MPEDCADLLAVASVIGTSFDVDLLAAVVDRSPLDCLDSLAEARRLGLVRTGAGPEQHHFADAAVHAEFFERVPARYKVELHARIAEAIGSRYADRLEEHLFELAAHWSAAAVGDHRPVAARWVSQAAEQAMHDRNYSEATRLFRRALDIGREGLGPDAEGRLLVGLAVASYRRSDVLAALDASEQAARLAQRAGLVAIHAEAALVAEPTLSPEVNLRVRELCTTALAALGEDEPGLRLRVLARLADVCHYLGDFAAASAACAEAERLAARTSDPTALIAFLHAQQMERSGPDGLEAREVLAGQLARVAGEIGDRDEMAWSHLWLVDVALERGDIVRARRELDSVHRLGADDADVLVRWQLGRAEATLAQAQGRYDDASRLADEAAGLLDRTDNPLGRMIWMGQLTHIRHHTGLDVGFATELGLLDDSVKPLAGTVQVLGEAWALVGIGRLDRAAARYQALGPAARWQPLPHSALFTWSYGVLCAAALGERDDVALNRDRLERYRGHHVVSGAGCLAYFGPVELWLGVAAAYLGDIEAAVADLERALQLCGGNGAVGLQAQAQLELSRVLRARGGANDVRRAGALAAEALRRSELLGMRPVAEAARALLDDVSAAASGSLTKREAEVAELVAQALSNRAIAQRLYLSERTVANHIQHVFDKLGLSSRTELVNWVHDNR